MSNFGSDPVPGMEEAKTPPVAAPIINRKVALRIINGPQSGVTIVTNREVVVVGRNDPPEINVDIDLTEAELGAIPMTSRRHAQIEIDPASNELYLIDLGSTNGTWIDGIRLSPRVRSASLKVPSRIRLANLELETYYVDH